ncbi:MAG: BLUF domain-containing protein [Pseudomonadota bacterium]
MRQILYVSDSRIGRDEAALDRIMERSRRNNALDGITGLLWSDGRRFAQVIEGGDEAIAAVLARIAADDRHVNLRIVQDMPIYARAFGDWSMERPAVLPDAAIYEERMLARLAQGTDRWRSTFSQIVARSRTAAW